MLICSFRLTCFNLVTKYFFSCNYEIRIVTIFVVTGHEMVDCTGAAKPQEGSEYVGEDTQFGEETRYIWVRLSVLREYLRRDLQMPNLPFEYDFERAIDDWVFMCFFVGNDFLPHLPSLEIREGAIDRLVRLYKDAVYKTGVSVTIITSEHVLHIC